MPPTPNSQVSSTLTTAEVADVQFDTRMAEATEPKLDEKAELGLEEPGPGRAQTPPSSVTKDSNSQDDNVVPEDAKKEKQELVIIIDWDVEPANPRNWGNARKWRNTAIVSIYTFITPLASSMMAPGLPAIAIHYGITNPTVVALTLSIYILAWAIGPLFVAPLSEIYGRLWVLHISNIIFCIFCLAQVFAPNTAALIMFRFFAGIGGCAPVAIGGSCISDMFNNKDRGTAMSVYTTGPLLGPVIGPIAGGFMVQAIGFKYVFVLLTVLAGFAAIIEIPFLEETYAPTVQKRLATRRARAKDLEANGHASQIELPATPDLWEVLRVNLSRPFLMLTRSLICFSLSLYMALTYGFVYLLFTTFATLFNEIYGWGPGVSGLAYLGPGVGFLLAAVFGTPIMNKIYLTLLERNGGKGQPEFRIPAMLIGSFLIPVGLFWYGWSAQARLHWIMPIIGTGIFGAGMMLSFIPIQLYLVDAFTYAASALATASVLRTFFGFAFPLFGGQMFEVLGLGGGNSLLAGLAILIGIPFPIWIYYRGEKLRAGNPLNR